MLLLTLLTSMNRRAYLRSEVRFERRTLSFVTLNLLHGLRARFVIEIEQTAAPTTRFVSYDKPVTKTPPLVSQQITNPTSASSPHSTAAKRSTGAPSSKKVDKVPDPSMQAAANTFKPNRAPKSYSAPPSTAPSRPSKPKRIFLKDYGRRD